MAILFVGSSEEDIAGSQPNTSALGRDASYTPVGAKITGDWDNSGHTLTIQHAQAASDVTWYHFLFGTDAQPSYSNTDGHWFRIYNGATIIAELNNLNAVTTLQGGGETSPHFSFFAASVNITYDIKVTTDGVNVTVEVFQNDISITSITYASAVGKPDRLAFEHYDIMWNTSAKDFCYSEFIITDNEPTTGWRLASLDPNIAGNSTAWDGAVTDIQDYDNGLSLSAGTTALKQGWTLSAYGGPATSSGVRALVNKFLASKGPTGPSQITPFIRHAATDVSGTSYTPDGTTHFEVLDDNPQTALGWDTADLATLEIGVESLT